MQHKKNNYIVCVKHDTEIYANVLLPRSSLQGNNESSNYNHRFHFA